MWGMSISTMNEMDEFLKEVYKLTMWWMSAITLF